MSANFYKNEMDRELLLNIEIQKQNLKALPERFKAQKNVVSPVTQQMIDDYKQQFRDSYKRTDDKGTSKFYKFLIPEAEPTLDIIDKDELLKSGILEKTLEPDKIKKAIIKIEKLKERYDEIQDIIIPEGYENIELAKKDINELTAKKQVLMIKYSDGYVDRLNANRQELLKNYQLSNNNKNKKKIKNDINKIDNEINKIDNEINEIDNEIVEQIKRIERIQQYDINERSIENINNIIQINALKKQLEVNDEIKLKNEKVLYTIEQNNKKKLADYAKTIQIMNNGEISLEQQQGESEQDYLKRLADVALIEEDPTRAFLYNTNQFKKNLKTLIKSEWKIENLVKSFSNDDQFLLNKTFAGFKKYFTNLYGPGNKDLDVEEYINIIREYIDSDATSLLKKAGTKREKEGEKEGEEKGKPVEEPRREDDDDEETKEDETAEPATAETTTAPATAVATIVEDIPEVEARTLPPDIRRSDLTFQNIKVSKKDDILRIENTASNNNLYFKLTEPLGGRGQANANQAIIYAINNKPFVFMRKGANFNTDLITLLNMINISDNDRIVLLYMINGRDDSVKADQRKITVTEFIDFFDRIKKGGGLKKTRTKSSRVLKPKKQLVVQKGASIKEVPYRCEFGKSVILLNKLYYNNILSVKDSKGINIQGIPNSKVDDKFVNIIMKICNNEDINNKDILELTDKDAILFSVLMNKSGLKKKYNIDNTKSIKALKDRLALVEGEMLAGNTNDEIKTELYDIVFKLAQLGATSLSVARKYFKDTEKLMF